MFFEPGPSEEERPAAAAPGPSVHPLVWAMVLRASCQGFLDTIPPRYSSPWLPKVLFTGFRPTQPVSGGRSQLTAAVIL